MAVRNKKKSREETMEGIRLDRLTERQERLLVYAAVVIIVLILFALEPGFFLGLILGILGYRYYLDNYSKSEGAAASN